MPSASIRLPALVRSQSSWSIAGAHYKHWATSLGNFGVTPFFGGNFLYCVLSSGLWSGFIPSLQFCQTAKGKAPKEAWGSHWSGWGINVTFLNPHEPQLSAAHCVTPNQIYPSYMICIRSLVVLSTVHITAPCPCLFLSAVTWFLEKGKLSDRLCWLVVWESCLRCSKILRIRRKFEV